MLTAQENKRVRIMKSEEERFLSLTILVHENVCPVAGCDLHALSSLQKETAMNPLRSGSKTDGRDPVICMYHLRVGS